MDAAAEPDIDTSLMLRYRSGDLQAFELLYARHKTALYRYLRQSCRDAAMADDVFQEVWSKVIVSRERYEPRAQFKTFLFKIAHNCAIDALRRTGRATERDSQSIDDVIDRLSDAVHERPDAHVAQAQLQGEVDGALARLPAEQRDTFVLYEESGLNLHEIAQLTGVSMETAKSRLRYALSKLRAALSHHRSNSFEQGVHS